MMGEEIYPVTVFFHIFEILIFQLTFAGPIEGIEAGRHLYDNHCSKCHQKLSQTTKPGRSWKDIQWAIEHIPLMKKGESLTKDQLVSLEKALAFENSECQQLDGYSPSKLNVDELGFLLSDTFGLKISTDGFFPQISEDEVFKNHWEHQVSSVAYFQGLLQFSEHIAKTLVAQSPLAESIAACKKMPQTDRCLKKQLATIMKRLWRRNLKEREVDSFWKDSLSIHRTSIFDAFQHALAKTISSPYTFLKGYEDTHGNRQFVLASRLSFLLWSSGPDERLLDLASTKQLRKNNVLESEIDRLMKSHRSTRLTQQFFSTWTQTDHLIRKDFTDLHSKKTISQSSRQIFLNRFFSLFEYYKSNADIPFNYILRLNQENNLKGLLFEPAWLLSHSSAIESSLTRRGRFIRERLLCSQLKPPVQEAEEGEKLSFEFHPGHKMTGQQKINHHLQMKSCKNCHQMMDPLGVALENFGPTGQWRTSVAGQKLNTKVHMPGMVVRGGEELANHLVNSRQVKNCLVETVLSYGVSRDIEHAEKCHVDKIREQAETKGFSFTQIVKTIVNDKNFSIRRGGLHDATN